MPRKCETCTHKADPCPVEADAGVPALAILIHRCDAFSHIEDERRCFSALPPFQTQNCSFSEEHLYEQMRPFGLQIAPIMLVAGGNVLEGSCPLRKGPCIPDIFRRIEPANSYSLRQPNLSEQFPQRRDFAYPLVPEKTPQLTSGVNLFFFIHFNAFNKRLRSKRAFFGCQFRKNSSAMASSVTESLSSSRSFQHAYNVATISHLSVSRERQSSDRKSVV